MFVARLTPLGLQLSNQEVNGNVPAKLNLLVRCWDSCGGKETKSTSDDGRGKDSWAWGPRGISQPYWIGLGIRLVPARVMASAWPLILHRVGYVLIVGCRRRLPLSDVCRS